MKIINNSKTTGQNQAGGFTLIEMIGVLAVIAILAALLLPKVADSISEAKINNAAGSYQTVATATTAFYAKNGSFVDTNSVALTPGQLANWDLAALVPGGYLDKPFLTKVGSGSCVQVVTGLACNGGAGYKLDGSSTAASQAMSEVVECVISNVIPQDAMDLSTTIDGASLTTTNAASGDTTGRVSFGVPSVTTGLTTVYMYVTGR